MIAVDIGTTSTKTLLLDREGQVVSSHTVGYPLHTPSPEIAEQEPDEIVQAVLQGIRQVMASPDVSKEDIVCVSFSAAMHSLIAVDENNALLTRMITWADSRSQKAAEQLLQGEEGLEVYHATGTPIHPMSPLVKLAWMKEQGIKAYQSAHKFIGIKEYIFYKLFGTYVIDYSLASATGLFNLESLQWDDKALAIAGISEQQLSTTVPTTHCMTGIHDGYADFMGLSPDTPVVVGASDGVLANLGAGVLDARHMAVSIGTSGAIRTVVPRPALDSKGRLFCYALTEDHWVIGGASNNGAIVLQWVIEQLYAMESETCKSNGQDPYEVLLKEAEKIDPGADGLLFLPLLTGERAPFWNADARGVFFGLSLSHTKAHMLRAALEGVMFQLAVIKELLQQMSGPGEEIIASGGFARSALWCQMMADIFGMTVLIPKVVDSSGLGAARLGLYALGEVDTLTSFGDEREGVRYVPNPVTHERYRQLLPLYQQVYEQLKGQFTEIVRFQPRG
ncbi:gluconokinase [Paenibacillus abyssi]|uniref:gluconokinase n=1 Tax=Paenibacillus abyssi TaxID=1340531 RepID=UPI0016688160|nr:FGGY family carbohydrate kinase [Paenibacillus abyssi]